MRLIGTTDDEVIASIVKATNRQTEVKQEQLLALSDTQKKLEQFFLAFEEPVRLFYERRSRQYNNTAGIEKTRVITFVNLIRVFASMFLEEPHRTTRNYRALLERVGKTIFGADDRLEPYYVSALASYRLEFLFRNQVIDARYKPARYHILFAARLLAAPERPPRMNSYDMEKYCRGIIGALKDANSAQQLFSEAVVRVEKTAAGNFDRDHIRTAAFTDELRKNSTLST